MGFLKTASVSTISVATAVQDGHLVKTAQYDRDNNSNYLSGRKSIDITAALELVASIYDISPNPEDYIFEAIRGNTTNVPNENSDAFHKHELLRFDGRIGKQVYRTYEFKPHHINHRAENPKNARGFIVDAHYNDASPPLEFCPNCAEDGIETKTAEIGNRDSETGIHCRKCGEVVKDEFVELLVAIDRKKDPTFAAGVMNGVLKHGSMGCSCVRTRCNVCNNVAYSRQEFCAHIRNKGKEYDDSEPRFEPIAFVIRAMNDGTAAVLPRKYARAFEWCEGVIYDEFSRVHDPADVKAEQYEVLQLTAKVAQLEGDNKLRNESEILLLQSRVAELERTITDKLKKVAQKGSDVNVNIQEKPEGVEIESEGELEELGAPTGTPISDLTPEAMGLTPAGPGETLSPAAAGLSSPPAPSVPSGVMPPAPPRRAGSKDGEKSMLRFASAYKHLKAEITTAGNVRIHDGEGTLFAVKPSMVTDWDKTASVEDLAKNVLTMIAKHGLGGAIRRTHALIGPRMAQVLEYYSDDMTDDRPPEPGSVLDDADIDQTEKRPKDKKHDTATGLGEETDRKENHDVVNLKNDVLTDRDTDLEDEQHDRSSDDLSVLEMHDSDARDKRKDWSLGDSTQDDVTLDHKGAAADKCSKCDKSKSKCTCKKAADKCSKCDKSKSKCSCKEATQQPSLEARKHAARLEKIYRARLDKRVAELEAEKSEFVKNFANRFMRAMKLVARRQALNLEFSPLKVAVGTALCSDRELSPGIDFVPMDDHTAVTVVEAAFTEPLLEGIEQAPWEAHIDGLFERAAEIMEYSDETLMQVEADLQRQQTVTVPMDTSTTPVHTADVDLRQQARVGNLQLKNPERSDTASSQRQNNRTNIRQAVGSTRVGSFASRV